MNPKIAYWLFISVLSSIVIIVCALLKAEHFNTMFLCWIWYLTGAWGALIAIPECIKKEQNNEKEKV